ncbi:hypothetical protein OIV83_001501 [Microbotryomycetes sp. JL201]|nr:hypothetical protein OIV83_001501 [Microbotryomycetes sp. JL201]
MASLVRQAQTNVFAPRSQAHTSTLAGTRTDQVPTTSVGDMLGHHGAASPSSSPSSPEYANLCKVVLERRLRNMFVLAVAIGSALLAAATFDPSRLPGSLFKVLPALMLSPVTFIGIVPIILLRKATPTTAPSTLSSRFTRVRSLLDAPSRGVIMAYMLSTAILSIAYQCCALYSSQNPRTTPIYYHKGRGEVMLNERFVFLAGFHAFVAAFGVAQHVFQDRNRLVFDSSISRSIPQRLAQAGLAGIRAAVQSTALSYIFFVSIYVVVKRPILRLLVTSSLTSWTRPHLYDMIRYSSFLSMTLIARSLASAFLLFSTWETAHALFQTYATQSMLVSQFSSKPNQALVSGLRSDDDYYKHFAFCELATLSLTSEQRRKTIFTDIKADVTRGAWADVSRECLKVLGQELQRAKNRGLQGQRTPPPPSSVGRSTRSTQTSDRPENPAVKKDEVFKPVKKTFWDKLASSDGSASQASTSSNVTKGASSAVSSAISTVSSRVPSILQADQRDHAAQSARGSTSVVDSVKQPIATATRTAHDVENVLSNRVPATLKEVAFTKDARAVVETRVARRQLVTWALEALANLLCASLKEDPYGVAQRDIPKILEGMVLFLDALEKLEKSLVSEFEQEGQERKKVGTAQVEELVLPLQSSVRDAIKQVLLDFEPFLKEFRFPSHVATRLQLLIDWG